jgi:hypothetical protein
MLRFGGPGLVAARLPGVLFGAALPVVLFVWLRRSAGRPEAWIASLLFAFYPTAIALSQIGRFYPAQVLLFWIGCLLFYRAVLDPGRQTPSTPLAVAAAVAWAGALHLQPVTAVGIAGVGVAAALLRGRQAWLRAADRTVPRWVLIPGFGLAIGLGFALLLVSRRALRMFRHADLWAIEHRSDLLFYHDRFTDHYGLLWFLVPVLLVAAVRKHRAPAVLAGGIFLLAITFHSLAAWKNERYLHYATPALFAILGLGAGAFLRGGFAAARGARSAEPRRRAGAALAAAAAGIAVITFATANAPLTAWRMALSSAPERPDPYPRSDWESARPLLEPIAAESDVFIASADLKALYFMRRLDFDLSADHLYDGSRFKPDFSPQSGTGTPVIRSPDALRRVIECYPTGLIAIERDHWRARDGVTDPAADLIETLTDPVPLPGHLHILAFGWKNGPASSRSTHFLNDCAELVAR